MLRSLRPFLLASLLAFGTPTGAVTAQDAPPAEPPVVTPAPETPDPEPPAVTPAPETPAPETPPADAPPVAAANPVTVGLEIYVVSQVTREDGTREERFTAATEARPGQVVEYRLTVTNVSEETLPPGIVVITTPVPEGTQYVPFSATPSDERLLTEFSADKGMTYYEVNVFVGEGEQRAIADPTAYDHVRWTLLVEMEPASSLTLVYRVTVR